eukprot:CAMPEP_0114625352 /NCGR_PEP_ID=MMETSP0168-20121206/11227_1 /TAXON_ID=95228 ORGANISM="Vannella sp., Strain DIVA3 517/6/12" /NCGR_SAMPLE_ID=MMETSP0168 /ASSEMBLY_ACC=CAM_ASM_000044 /LENGTH=410 /DNA_ID=CAMNT_0001836633 /DNA_START=49 /DNA_END=1278 /DNA_ORIENTATION=+
MASRPETNLVQVQIPSPMQAPEVFGTKTASGGTPIVLVPIKSGGARMRIPIGCSAIVTKRGASVGIYQAGTYFRPMFYRVAYMVTSHHIPYHFNIKACPTRDNVLIELEVDFLLHVSEPETFVYSIGPENMEELLRATQAESVRTLVRTISVSKAYDLRGYESQDMLVTLNEKMNKYGIVVDQVTISNIQLPKDLALSMQRETTFETKQTEQQKTQEYELMTHQDSNALKKIQLERKNEALQVEEEAKKERLTLQHQIQELNARMQRVLAEILEDERAEVNCIRAQAEMDVSRKQNELRKLVTEIQEESLALVDKIRANAQKEIAELKADAAVTIAQNDAKATLVLAKAEKEAAAAMVGRRKFLEAQERIGVLTIVAENKNVVIAGESGDNVMQMMCVRESAKALGISKR